MVKIVPPSIGPMELDRAESFAQVTGITTAVDVAGLSIDFEVGGRPVDVWLFFPWVTAVSQVANIQAIITDAGGTQKGVGSAYAAVNGVGQVQAFERITTPGTYSRKAQIARSGTGTLTLSAGVATTTSFIVAISR